MRLAAQVKCGFYPIPPEALTHVIEETIDVDSACERVNILDPCCGQGNALKQLGWELSATTYGIEMDGARSKEASCVNHLLPDTDYLSSKVSPESMSMVWCNPPYDDELGGGRRLEYSFVTRAARTLVTGGIMALACPERVSERRDIREHFLTWYRNIRVVPYPDEHRKFNEVVILGQKRSQPTEAAALDWNTEARNDWPLFKLKESPGPKRFEKSGYTKEELEKVMATSSLNRLLLPPPPKELPRPALQLSAGQRALVLAGGFLNQVLRKPGEDPVLIKATPYKVQYTKSEEVTEEEDAKGKPFERTVTIKSQRIILKVRVLTGDGIIHNLE